MAVGDGADVVHVDGASSAHVGEHVAQGGEEVFEGAADDEWRVSVAEEQRKADQQQKRREETERKQKERLDYALKCIDDYSGSISRKQLTEILMKKFELSRATVSAFISRNIGCAFYEVEGMIQLTPDNVLPL